MNGKKIALILGTTLGSGLASGVSFGIYGSLRDRNMNPWGAGFISGGVSSLLALGLAFGISKLTEGGSTGALPPANSLRTLSKGLTSAAVNGMNPGVPRLGPVRVSAYTANPVMGAYTANPVAGCAGCE